MKSKTVFEKECCETYSSTSLSFFTRFGEGWFSPDKASVSERFFKSSSALLTLLLLLTVTDVMLVELVFCGFKISIEDDLLSLVCFSDVKKSSVLRSLFEDVIFSVIFLFREKRVKEKISKRNPK